MAELHVQTKKHNSSGSTWIWIVLVLLILAAVAYYLMTRNKTADNTTPPANTTGAVNNVTNPFSIEALLERQNAAMYLC